VFIAGNFTHGIYYSKILLTLPHYDTSSFKVGLLKDK